jgi:hypothetical protein
MGLDSYLFRGDKPKKSTTSTAKNCDEVAYWRKFNALHKWFVTHVQIGIDDCRPYEVTKDDLEDLLRTLDSVLIEKNYRYLPPCAGFFFGPTEVDDWYFKCVEEARATIQEILTDTDWEKQMVIYQASW